MHMCSTVGLGGFSSYEASLGHFNSPLVEMVAPLFMALAIINFLRYFIVLRSHSFGPLLRDRGVRSYIIVLLVSIVIVTVRLRVHGVYAGLIQALRASAFHVVSVATTTGHTSTDYAVWPAFAPVLLLFLGSSVSCAGSTGGGHENDPDAEGNLKTSRTCCVPNHDWQSDSPCTGSMNGAAC